MQKDFKKNQQIFRFLQIEKNYYLTNIITPSPPSLPPSQPHTQTCTAHQPKITSGPRRPNLKLDQTGPPHRLKTKYFFFFLIFINLQSVKSDLFQKNNYIQSIDSLANAIEKGGLSNLTYLEIGLGQNQIKSIDSLAKAIQNGGLSNLKLFEIYIDENQIQSIDSLAISIENGGLPKLTTLRIDFLDNQIKTIDSFAKAIENGGISNLNKLQIFFSSNQIQSLDSLAKSIDNGGLSQLTILEMYFDYNQISSIDSLFKAFLNGGLSNLTQFELCLSYNQIQSIDSLAKAIENGVFSNLTHLNINLENNQIQSIESLVKTIQNGTLSNLTEFQLFLGFPLEKIQQKNMKYASNLVYLGKRSKKSKKSQQPGSQQTDSQIQTKIPKKQFMDKNDDFDDDDDNEEEEKQQEQQIQRKMSMNSYSSSDSDSEDNIDTNVVEIDFNFLKNNNNIAMGDPIYCQKCQAVLNKYSQVLNAQQYLKIKKEQFEQSQLKSKEQQEKDDFVIINKEGLQIEEHEKVWNCEFCGEENKIRVEPEEIPTEEDIIYIVEAANQQEKKDESDFSIIFCLDNSGSMSVTTEVEGQKMNLKHGLSKEEYEMLKQFIDAGDENQVMPGQKNNSTFVSRKQCVLAAIESQLQDMSKDHPDRKVGVVTFSDDVIIMGDGHSNEPTIITGDKLYDQEKIKEDTIQKAENLLKHTIKDSIKQLSAKFDKIEEKGRTALGPALLSSIQLAGKGKPGSMVVICTDGLANMGLGSLDIEEEQEKSKEFYENLAQTAKDLGIVISVITIKGEGCKIEILGKLAEQTNGTVTRVDPKDIGKDFASILEDEVLGTKVQLNLQLHKSLQFRNENKKNLAENGSKFNKNIGNATVNTRITFEYQAKPDEILQMEKIDLDDIKVIPFQAKVYYYNLKGDKYLRVLSQQSQATRDKKQAELEVKEVGVIHNRIAQQSANFMQSGKVKKAQKFNSKYSHYVKESNNINSIQDNIQSNLEFEQQNYMWKKCANKQVSRKKCAKPSSSSSQNSQKEKGFFSKVKNIFSSSKSKEENMQVNEIQQQQQQQYQLQKPNLQMSAVQEEDIMFSASDGGYSSDEDKDEAMMINFKQGKMKK